MFLARVLGIIVVLLSVLFLGLQVQDFGAEAEIVRTVTLMLLIVLYVVSVKNKHLLFLLFLVVFTSVEVLNHIDLDAEFDYLYYIGNGLYILSYLLLIGRILAGIRLTKVVSKFPWQTVLLAILVVFVVYLVTDTTKSELSTSEYALEFAYNTVIMILMSFALLNYMYRDNKKSMNLLLGCICIVLSEIIQVTYFYIAEQRDILNVLCSAFLVSAFLFFYLQSTFTESERPIRIEQQ